MQIDVNIKNKIACLSNTSQYIVCGNSDYVINFSFDEEWDSFDTKTARFIKSGQYTDVVFQGNQCDIPIIFDTDILAVGVFSGDLRTTTPAFISCKKSILDEYGTPAPPSDDVYNQLVEIANETKGIAQSVRTDADNGVFDGADGYTPQRGTDYWTTTDKAEIVNDVLETDEIQQLDTNEQTRISNESIRISNEETRQANETARQNVYNSKAEKFDLDATDTSVRCLNTDSFDFEQDDFEQGGINNYTGAFTTSSTRIRTIHTLKFPCDVTVKVKDGYKYLYHIYLNGVWQKAISKSGYFINRKTIPANTEVRFILANTSDTDITSEEFNNLIIEAQYKSPIKSWGESNANATLNQLQNISYKLLADVKGVGTPTLYAGNYTGIPYSQTKQVGKLVGTDILLDTFVTAAHNPRSVIYTRTIIDEVMSGCYYGMHCINLVLAVWGFPFYINCITFPQDMPNIEKVEWQDIKPLDAINSADVDVWHAKLIKNVEYDKYGRVITVTTIESKGIKVTQGTNVTPLFTVRSLSFDDFVSECKTLHYELFRYNKLSSAGYTPSKYIAYYDDDVVDNTYSDIVTEYGDKCALPVGTDLTVNVLNSEGYNLIAIYKDDVLQSSTSTIDDFNLTDLAYGTYRIEMSGDSKETCQTDFIIVDVNASLDGNTVSFSSANADCICVKGLNNNWTVKKTLIPTEADLSSGTIDVSSIQETADVSYIRVGFRCKYGNVYTDIPYSVQS